jgi:hypothetical protein
LASLRSKAISSGVKGLGCQELSAFSFGGGTDFFAIDAL